MFRHSDTAPIGCTGPFLRIRHGTTVAALQFSFLVIFFKKKLNLAENKIVIVKSKC